jgi:hypothetical protein
MSAEVSMRWTTTAARPFVKALIILLGAGVAVGNAPTAGAQEDATWDINLWIGSEETEVSSDGDYCLMPSTMAIRPGNWVHLRNQDGKEIESVRLVDSTELVSPDSSKPGDPCALVAEFKGIPGADGYVFTIVPNPVPEANASLSYILLTLIAITEDAFRVFYNGEGLRQCDVAEESPIRLGAAIQTTPESFGGPSTTGSSFGTIDESEYSEERDGCRLYGAIIFPAKAASTEQTVKEYEIAVGQVRLS